MDKLPTRLRVEPIIEAVWEVRFASSSPAVVELLAGSLLRAIDDPNAKAERLGSADLPRPVREADSTLRYLATLRFVGSQYVLGLGEHVVCLNCVRPYPGWSQFRGKILKIIAALKSSGLITQPERFSLKYVDILETATTPSLAALDLAVSMGSQRMTTEPVQLRLELKRDDFFNVITVVSPAAVQTAAGDKLEGVLVDVDTISIPQEPVAPTVFWGEAEALLDRAHGTNKRLFFENLLSKATVVAHGPEY